MSLTSKRLGCMFDMLKDMRDCTSEEYKQFSNALYDSIESFFHTDKELAKSILDAELDAAIDDAIKNASIMIETIKNYTDAMQQEEKNTDKDDDDTPKTVKKPEDWEDSWSEKAYVPSKNDPFASEEDSDDDTSAFSCEDPFDVGIEVDDEEHESCCGKCHHKEEKKHHHHHHRHHHRHRGHHRSSNPLKTESAEYAEVNIPNFWDKLLDDMIDPNSAIRSGGFKYKFKALPKGAVRDVGNCPYVKVEETEQGYNIIIEYR